MNIWANAVITDKGLALQSKLTQGNTLNITKAVTGTGYVTPVTLAKQTAVTGPKQTLTFNPVSYPEAGKCAMPVYLNNDDVETGYTAVQIGIYATDPDEGEILYFIAQAASETNGTEIPSKTEMPGYCAEWTFYFQYGQADSVSVTVDPAGLSQYAQKDLSNVTDEVFAEKASQAGAGGIPVVTTTGTGSAYTATVPNVKALTTGLKITIITHTVSTTTTPTLDVNGLGAVGIRRRISNLATVVQTGYGNSWLAKGKAFTLEYDGSYWIVIAQTKPSAVDLYGQVPIANGGTGASTADQARVNLGIDAELANKMEVQALTTEEYEALEVQDANTMYVITDDNLDERIEAHMADEDIHVTSEDKADWNAKADTRNGTVISENALYADVVEWVDGNLDDEDRIGFFVSMTSPADAILGGYVGGNGTIGKATSSSEVYGVTIDSPGFAGNCSAVTHTNKGNLHPSYEYVATSGIVTVVDDGTCEERGRCIPSDSGIAVPSTNGIGYLVIERIDSNHIRILLTPGMDMIQKLYSYVDEAIQTAIGNAIGGSY